MNRKIYITGEINNDSYEVFSRRFSFLDKTKGVIYIELMSDGGYSFAALAFYDKIINSDNDVHISAYGLVASAATLILAAGDFRRIAKNAWCMVHEDEPEIPEGARVKQFESIASNARMFEEQWAHLLEENTSASSGKWAELHLNETYLTPTECLDLGLVDEIITPRWE